MTRGACAAAAALGAAAVFALTARLAFPGGASLEFCHYGEIGRNIAEGRGPKTGVLYPAEAALLAAGGADMSGLVPPLGRFPLFALLVGASEALVGSRDAAVLAASGLALSGAAAAAAWVFFPMLGFPGSLTAALLFALSPSATRGFALWGTPDLLFCALLLLFHDSWIRRRDWRAVGLLAGLCWLSRPNFLLFLPVYALDALRRKDDARRAACAAAAAALTAAPWALWQTSSGAPLLNPNFFWNLATGVLTPEPGWRYVRVFSLGDLGPEHLLPLAGKAALALGQWLSAWPSLWQMGALIPLAVYGAARAERSEGPLKEWFRLNAALLLLQGAAFSLLRVERLGAHVAGRYELWFAPVLAAAAVAGWREARERFRLPRWAAPAALVLFGSWYGRFYALPELGLGHPAGPPPAWPELELLRGPYDAAFVATNIPAHVGWYAGRRAVLLPAGPEEFEKLRALLPLGPVLLSTLPAGQVADMPYWLSLLRTRAEAEGFCARFGYRIAFVSPQALLLLPDRT